MIMGVISILSTMLMTLSNFCRFIPIFMACFLVLAATLPLAGCNDEGQESSEHEIITESVELLASTASQEVVLPIELSSHKALYDVSLTATHGGSQIVNISGKMYYELNKSCDAWSTAHRFYLNYDYADMPSMRRKSDFSTYEAFDGSSFSFSSRRMNDSEVFEEIRGSARKGEDGQLLVQYSMPEQPETAFKTNIRFPMTHTRDVLSAMAEGKQFFSATIFDGSDLEGPIQVNAFLGDDVDPKDYGVSADIRAHDLLSIPARHLRLAFFSDDSSGEGSSANYEMDMVFHKNGVIQHMDVDYKDFSIAQHLVALEAIDDQCAENSSSSE
jgi:hypothetical protein